MRHVCLALIVFLGLNLSACMSKDLSRDKATEILTKINYGYIEGTIPVQLIKDLYMGPDNMYEQQAKQEYNQWSSETIPYLDKLKANGLINYTMHQGILNRTGQPDAGMTDYLYQRVVCDIQPTSKLTPYIIASDNKNMKVKLIDIVFDKITGISKTSDNEAVAEFIIKLQPTALNGIVEAPQTNVSFDRSAAFRRYDDGWRLIN